MTCEQCEHIVDRKDSPHFVRECENCGRTMYVPAAPEDGSGIVIQEGDRFVIPGDWLKPALNPLEGHGHLTEHGVRWLVKRFLLAEFPSDQEDLTSELQRVRERCNEVLQTSEMLRDLDLDDPDEAEEAAGRLKNTEQGREWWAALTGAFMGIVEAAIAGDDTEQAVWAAVCAERCRSMLVFEEHLREPLWMAQSARRLLHILKTWDSHKSNDQEDFWQRTFSENSYVLSQVFSVPVVLIQEQAYLGGAKVDRKGGKLVDYLFSSEFSRESILVEIKTPQTELLGPEYRGVLKPSGELAGSVVQLLDYRNHWMAQFQELTQDQPYEISAFDPKCVLIAGNGEAQLTEDVERRSFELFRTGLKDVEIVTYDELFRKIEVLASLFNLVRQSGDSGKPDDAGQSTDDT